jgi:hypothetical protein
MALAHIAANWPSNVKIGAIYIFLGAFPEGEFEKIFCCILEAFI